MDFTLTEEQEKMKEKAREFAEKELCPYIDEWDTKDNMPVKQVVKKALPYGILGITIPKEYGGQGLTVLDFVISCEEACRVSHSWLGAMVHYVTSGAGVSLITGALHEAAKRKYLPKIAKGDMTAAITMTEPNHGSDVTYLETTATPDGDYYIVNGEKSYITNADQDDLLSTYVRFGGIPQAAGVGALVIERDSPGVELPEPPRFVGFCGMHHNRIRFRDVRVPKENLLFEEGHMAELMTSFNMERMTTAVMSLGVAQAAYDGALKYVSETKRFGTEVINFQALQHYLTDMWIKIEAARLLVYRAAVTAIKNQWPKGMDVCVAKVFANEMGLEVTGTALLMQGGTGCDMAFPTQRCWRDAMTLKVAGGTVEVIKDSIAQWLVPERKLARIYRYIK